MTRSRSHPNEILIEFSAERPTIDTIQIRWYLNGVNMYYTTIYKETADKNKVIDHIIQMISEELRASITDNTNLLEIL
jgi:hypothetical protein